LHGGVRARAARQDLRCRARVRDAFFAAADRPFVPFVRAALRAACERDAALRDDAARFAWLDNA
jgi:hypothetical protein